MAAGEQYKAKYDFEATGDGMLSFKARDQFSLVRKTNTDWWTVRSMSGEVGMVPVTYLEVYQARGGGPSKSAAYTTLYDYTAQDGTQLSFCQGETLMLMDKTDVSWWSMRTSSGEQGLVPVNYIDKLDTEQEKHADKTDGLSKAPQSNGSLVNPEYEQVLLSIDSNIGRIHDMAAAHGGKYTSEQRKTLNTLVKHRQGYVDTHGKSTSNHTLPKTITQPAKSPGSSPKADKKLQALTPNSSPPRPNRQAPPPPADANKKSPQSKSYSESNQVIRRENRAEINALKDNRYSLQVDPNITDQYRPRFDSLPRRRSAPAPPNRRDSISNSTSSGPSGTGKPPLHPSAQGSVVGGANVTGVSTFSPSTSQQSSPSKHSNTSPRGRRYSTDIVSNSPQNVSPGTRRRNSDDVSGSPPQRAYTLNTPRTSDSAQRNRRRTGSNSESPHVSRSRSSSKENESLLLQSQTQPPKIELPTTFTRTDGSELVESVRSRTGISYRKTLVAVCGVLEFLKSKVPVCTEMVDGLVTAVQESQAQMSPATTRKAEASSDLDRLREIFFEITELKNDSQQRGWAVHDDQQAIVDIMEELLQILCDANPDITKAAVEEDKYENVLTLITYCQMENRLPIRLLLLKVFGVLCGLDKTVISVLLSSVLPNELGRDIQQNLTQIQKTLYSCTVCTMIFSTSEAVPLPVYDQWSGEYVRFLLETVESPPLEDDEEQIPDAFLNMILSFNQHFPDPSTNLVMKALKQCDNPRNFSEKLMFLVNRGEDPVAISEPCSPDSMTKFLLDLFSDKSTSGLFYTTDMMVLIDIVARQLADLGPEEETRVHYLELLYRIVDTTNYTDHKHRHHELVTCLNRIAQEEDAEGTPDYELVRKIWKTYPGVFEEITDL